MNKYWVKKLTDKKAALYNLFAQKHRIYDYFCFWGPAHCHFWKFHYQWLIAFWNWKLHLVFASHSKSLTTRPHLLLMTIFSVKAPLCNWKAIVKKALMQQKLPLLKIIQLFRPLKVTRLVNNLYPSMDM